VAADVRVAEGFHYLCHPVTRRPHELMEEGELSKLRAAEADMPMPAPDDTDPAGPMTSPAPPTCATAHR
jgi:predicted dehydrogenase